MKTLLSIKNLKKIYHDLDGEVCAIGDVSIDVYDKKKGKSSNHEIDINFN